MDAGSSSSEDTGSSSSEEKQRICAILNMDSDYYAVYIIDIVSEDGAADDDAIVDLNRVDTYRFARQFVERDPNFFIQDFTETDGLCALGSTIFMFEGVDYRRIKVDTLYRSMGIYSFPLPAEHMVRTAGTEPIPCYHKNFGGVRFGLDLASANQKWELFGVHLSLPCNYQHFITEDMLVLSSYGVHPVGYEYESSAIIHFPLCSFVSPQLERKTSSIMLLDKECVACIVQVGKDDSERPFWTMDVVELNHRPYNYDGQFARRFKSFKFAFLCNSDSSCIAGLFAF
ncbi:uncharacterized protein LOC131020889 [Salvia miltiorrhiza]|uniref:uncharacterized protein LOC131020889 n=1 Tax=Salvia miltiorrhiza TaxID=226208 RepID=UPI0025AC1E7E|nr:uncharacterized protein LOC131020889 [Salvia miltiorrhiza]